MKSILKTNYGATLVAFILSLYCRLCFYTNRFTFIGKERFLEQFDKDKPLVFVFWHNRLFFMPFFDKDRDNTYALISKHGDGELLTKTIGFLGAKRVSGSTNRPATDVKGAKDRGGVQAVKDCVRLLKSGSNIAITPDGPKGPRMIAQIGAVNIAKMAEATIIPLTSSSSKCKIFKSWDRFLLPLPFGKSVCIYGEPIEISENATTEDLENTRKEIENQLNNITREADTMAGITPIEPDSQN